MQLKNDDDGQNSLRETVLKHYKKLAIVINLFLLSDQNGWHYEHFLLDRKHVFRYGIGEDRRMMVGSLELGIGPHYFSAADFWDYPNFKRFSIEASTESVERNLSLFDEFLGYVPIGTNGSLDEWLNQKR